MSGRVTLHMNRERIDLYRLRLLQRQYPCPRHLIFGVPLRHQRQRLQHALQLLHPGAHVFHHRGGLRADVQAAQTLSKERERLHGLRQIVQGLHPKLGCLLQPRFRRWSGWQGFGHKSGNTLVQS